MLGRIINLASFTRGKLMLVRYFATDLLSDSVMTGSYGSGMNVNANAITNREACKYTVVLP